MDAKLPVRLRVLLPVVENAISCNAYRPGDVLATRKGLSVEIGNTDAEGRVILCDALALGDEEKPDLLIDIATLTGAARVALGPELPALFSNDDASRTSCCRARPRSRIRCGACRCGAATTTSCRARSPISTTCPAPDSPARSSARCSCAASSPRRAPGCTSISTAGTVRIVRPAGRRGTAARACPVLLPQGPLHALTGTCPSLSTTASEPGSLAGATWRC